MPKVMLFLWVLVLVSAPLFAQDYCPLEVHVVDGKGYPVPNVMVRAAEDDGLAKQVERHDGTVQFCDFGIRPVHVRVGSSACLNIFLENVQLSWRQPRRLTVVYDDGGYCNVDRWSVGPVICFVLLRFLDFDEKPLAGVSLVPPPPTIDPVRSDRAGRMMLTVKSGPPVKTSARLPGYAPEPIEEDCSKPPLSRERIAALQRQ